MTSGKGFKILTAIFCMLLINTAFASGMQYNGTVLANDSLVRDNSSFDGEVLAKLQIGTEVLIEEIKNDWYRITDPASSLSGWMYKDLVSAADVKTDLKSGRVTASVLNVRSGPSTADSIIKRLAINDKVTIINQDNVWFEIALSLSARGWVHSDFIQLIPNYPEGRITIDRTNMLKEKDLNSEAVRSLDLNTRIYIRDYKDGWYNILLEDFAEGWIVEASGELQLSGSKAVSRSGERAGALGNIREVTSKYLGKEYSWGRTGPDRFDCSGFTTYIFRTYYEEYLKEKGISLPRTSREQAGIGTSVGADELLTGDLVFFNTDSRSSGAVTHVGIYLGNGEFVHASSAGGSVVVSSMDRGYYRQRFLRAKRL